MAAVNDKNNPKKEASAGEQQGQNAGTMAAPQRRGTMMRQHEWEPLHQLRHEFDRLFDQFTRAWPMAWPGEEPDWRWGLDVHETDDAVTVRAEAPGFEPADFDLQVRGDPLILR